jgi:LysM repeat protein
MLFIFLLILLLSGLATSAIFAQEATDEPAPEATDEPAPTESPVASGTTYTVRPGDNLFRIALRFGTTTSALATENGITNPRLIFANQVLRIPSSATVPTTPTQPEPTQEPTQPPAGSTYTVQVGDTLFRVAVRQGTTVAALVQENGIANPNIIFVGQVLRIPSAAPAGSGSETSNETNTEDVGGGETVTPVEIVNFNYGVEAFFNGQDVNSVVQQITQLGVNWAKVPVDWSEIEATQGQPDFTQLDSIVNTLGASGVDVLLTVTNAPAWARTNITEEGPPDNLADFGVFMGTLAERYSGKVAAYEIWDEPNLRRNWSCRDDNDQLMMCDTDYVAMLRLAYDEVKGDDAEALIITAGLAPTRFNDRINAIDDRIYLQTLYANGAADISDGIGAHPGGWANPPDASCCEQPIGVDTHFENDSFYFLNNLNAYRAIMEAAGDTQTALWVTKFGWGSSEDTDPPNELNVFVTYTSLNEQAIYIPRAFEIGKELGFVGPMFLDNLNGCLVSTGRIENCYTSLTSPLGAPRPAFNAVQSIDKSVVDGGMAPDSSPNDTTETSDSVQPADASETTDTSSSLPPDEGAETSGDTVVEPEATETTSP